MVREQLAARDIVDARVLAAMGTVPRHAFVPESERASAYDDRPLPIGYDVTISQPYIVALMTQLAAIEPGARVLDVGTGSGYQAAVLAELGARVFGVELIEPLAAQAAARLQALGYAQVSVRAGDGWQGWPEHAPYDAIIVAAAAARVPEALRQQLAIGGRLVIPVGVGWSQVLLSIERTATGFRERTVAPVAFVPLVEPS